MGRLYIVAGAAGHGKKFFLEKFDYLVGVEIIKKYTTKHTSETNIDLIGDQTEEYIKDKCQYTYRYGSNNDLYGIDRADIDAKLSQNLNPIVIVRNCEQISKIKQDYPDSICINIQSCLGKKKYQDRMLELKYKDKLDIDERIKRADHDYTEYRNYIHLFDYNILNRFDDTINSQIQNVVSKIKDINRNSIFVIMPFSPEFNNVYEAITNTENRINGRAKDRQIKIYRVDKQTGSYIITEKIYEAIDSSAIIICDISLKERYNVFFELGYAEDKNKKIILIANKDQDAIMNSYCKGKTEDICIKYDAERLTLLTDELEKEIKQILKIA